MAESVAVARRRARWARWALMWGAACALSLTGLAQAQPMAPGLSPAASDRDEPGAVVLRAPAEMAAAKATAWSAAGAQWLLLEGDVAVAVGHYAFEARAAVARLRRSRDAQGEWLHITWYLDEARSGPGAGGVQAQGQGLIVSVSTRGGVQLRADLLDERDASEHPLTREASARFARVDDPEAVNKTPAAGAAQPTLQGASPAARAPRAVRERDRVLPGNGVVSWHAREVVIALPDAARDRPEGSVSLVGEVRVVYQDTLGGMVVTLTAENAVIFFRGGEAAGGDRLSAGAVLGVYLEDNVVATDGTYTVRAPKAYYDLPSNRALLLNAVFFTWDARRRIPLYLRAQSLAQEARDTWVARGAVITTSDFHTPHLAIGSDEVTLREQREQPASGPTGNSSTRGGLGSPARPGVAPAGPAQRGGVPTPAEPRRSFVARDNTIRVSDVPVFYWPYFAGEAAEPSLRRVTVGYDSDVGVEVRTRWNFFAFLGVEVPPGVDLDADIDYRGGHLAGLGGDLRYTGPQALGRLRGYIVPLDHEEDRIGSRTAVPHDGEARGYAQWRHRQYLPEGWELSLEGAYVSDPPFLEEFFQSLAREEKPFETSLYLKHQEESQLISLLVSTDFNRFTPQLPTLQSPGYGLEKLPEVAYFDVGSPWLGRRLTYYAETRGGALRVLPGLDRPRDRGLTNRASREFFGLPDRDTPFDQALEASGVPDDHVLRLDTRHELQAPLAIGSLHLTPYVTGRLTAYDDGFAEFRGESEQARLHGVVGTRVHTQFHRAAPAVRSTLLDLDGLRHVLEPSADLSLAGANLNPEDLPIFDPEVEGLTEGGTLRVGFRNTLQTRRGDEGRQRSVDWITLDTDLLLRSDDADIARPLVHAFGHRPELTTGGDALLGRLRWLISDALAVVGESTWSLERDEAAQWRVGATLRHGEDLTTFLDYAEIDSLDSRLLTYGLDYQLTRVYSLAATHTLDFADVGESRSISLSLERRFPQWRLRLYLSIDELDDEQTLGFTIIPEGLTGGGGVAP